jgi:uncharacterized protein YbaP (TraB family)
MKRIIPFLIFANLVLFAYGQPKTAPKKYPSLLWEITGKGLKKPSYLIGTMHVSSKLAFNLPDSFYIAVRNATVVALETNPETWQEDMSKYDFTGGYDYGRFGLYSSMPDDYFTINTLKFYKYHEKIEKSLYSNPSTINNLLYRSYGNDASDFEEDTYLDMYIFQCGKKWGKKVAGVESYGESMRLMQEAYKDAAKDKNKKERSYGDIDEAYTPDKLQEAYRSGNLDLLDSINRFNSFSAAFDEKFLYKRNEIQANSIDSIIKSGQNLFVGVGAAHLPGDRGVIEMLRNKGYKLRPIKMGQRASKEKDLVDKIRVPVSFRTETADDGLFKVDIPGKFYKFGDNASLDQKQYADMANGSYYMVTRIMTNAWMWNHKEDDVYKVLDSLLYENVPGKILSKTPLTKNGYRGLDIVNRTRRGDMQRYNIFITPFEIILFKMSGNSDYVKNGEEAKKFFSSIQFKEYKNGSEVATWKKWSPPYGGFAVDLPHEPYIGNDGSWIYDATDKQAGVNYRIIRSDIHNLGFVEEDTFDLALMDESFMASEFIDTQLVRKQTNYKGYPALDAKYKDDFGNIYRTRFIIQGPHYYTLVAHAKQETPAINNFFNSFDIKPFVYGEAKLKKDTSMYYSVTTPVFPEDKKIKLEMPQYGGYGMEDDEEEESMADMLESGMYRSKIIKNDTTGEKIYVGFTRSPRYFYTKDSAAFEDDNTDYMGDSTWIVKLKKKETLPNNMRIWETILTDTGSSRTIWAKSYYRNGVGFSLLSLSDTMNVPGPFTKKFYESFSPADTLKGANPFLKKSSIFFEDFFSKDTVAHKRAVKHIGDIKLDSTDMLQLKTAISSLGWKEKNYLDVKASLIDKLGGIKTQASADYLKELYYSFDDTVQLQYPALEAMLQQKTSYAYNTFRAIINNEPPVLEFANSYEDYSRGPRRSSSFGYDGDYRYSNGEFLDELSDSLQLTKTILPDLLPLLNLQDYKSSMMKLLGEMADSNLLKPQDYESYFSKFLIEAKQELKKQSIAEKKKAIQEAEDSKKEKKASSYYDEVEGRDTGNDDMNLYAKLLLPFIETNTSVRPVFDQLLKSNDKKLKYSTMMMLVSKNKTYPDSLLNYFAGLDEYRYELYKDLIMLDKAAKFPARYNNHLDLSRSELVISRESNKPDTLVFMEKMSATYKNKKGYFYFYKYKNKKDDVNWKLAVAGLLPEDIKQYSFENTDVNPLKINRNFSSGYNVGEYGDYHFTDFMDVKIKDDEPVSEQLKKQVKKLLYGKRKSAKKFYQEDTDRMATYDYMD